MSDSWITIECSHPSKLVTTLVDSAPLEEVKRYDEALISRYLLDYLMEYGAEVSWITGDGEVKPSADYQAVLPGGAIQIRAKQVLLDSVRDWVILLVLAASVLKGDVTGVVVGAAIASFVKSALANTRRLNVWAGERCVIRAVLRGISTLASKRPIEADEIENQLRRSACVFKGCRYQTGKHCTLTREDLDAILDQLVSDGVLLKRVARSYELLW